MALDVSADLAVFFDPDGGLAERAVYLSANDGSERPLAVVLDALPGELVAGGATVQVPTRRVLAMAAELADLAFCRGDRLRLLTGASRGTFTVSSRRPDPSGDLDVLALGAAS